MKVNTHTKSYPWICWGLAAMIYLVQYGLLVFPSAITGELSRSLSASPIEIGILASSFLYTWLIMQIPAGLMFDKYSSRNILFYSTLLLALSCVMLAFSPDFFWALISRLLMGIGASFAFVGALYLGRNWFSALLFPIIVGLTEAVSGVGELGLSSLFALLKDVINWRVLLFQVAMLVVAFAVLIYFFIKDKRSLKEKHEMHVEEDLTHALKTRKLWLLGMYTGFGFAHYVVMADMWGVPELMQQFNLTPMQAVLENGLVILGLTVGCGFIGYAVRYFQERRLMLLCALCQALLLWVVFFDLNLSLFVESVLLFLLGVVTSSVVLSYDMAKRLVPANGYGVATGFINMMFVGIGILLMPMTSYILQTTDNDYVAASWPLMISSMLFVIFGIVISMGRTGWHEPRASTIHQTPV